MRVNVARSGDGDFRLLRLNCTRIDVARSRDLIFGRLRLARSGFDSARAGDRQFQRLDIHVRDVEPTRTGDATFEAVALDLVDIDVARSGDCRAAELRDGDGEVRPAVARPAEVEPAVLFRADEQFVALDLNHGAFEQLFRPARRHSGVAARAHLDIVGTGDLDLLEIADLIAAGDGPAAVPVMDPAARGRRCGSGNHGRGDGLAHGSSCYAVLSWQYTGA